jgi:hypothetical protein
MRVPMATSQITVKRAALSSHGFQSGGGNGQKPHLERVNGDAVRTTRCRGRLGIPTATTPTLKVRGALRG